MATAEQLAELRRFINEPDNVDPYTDAFLNALIDGHGGDVAATAADLWRQKASSYADLVDVQEGSSRRSLSKLYEQALGMGSYYDQLSGGGEPAGGQRPSRTRRIVRP